MANISKWMAEARRQEDTGDLSGAIDQYRKALALQEEATGTADISLYNRIGDLYLRCGDPERALASYAKAADQYEDQQLYSNAIALCKKMLRNAPDHSEAHRRVARLFTLSGLDAEARSHYIEYCDQVVTAGQELYAVEALSEYAELAGTEDSRLLLAERLESLGHVPQAVGELQKVWEARARERGPAAEIREWILRLDPSADPKLSVPSDPPSESEPSKPETGSDDQPTELATLAEELQHVLARLDGVERLRQALPIVNQLLEFDPERVELIQRKLAYALALGEEGSAVDAYLALGNVLDDRLQGFSLRILTTSSSDGSVTSAVSVESGRRTGQAKG